MSTRTEEPVLISGAIMGVIVSGIGLAVLFGVPFSPDQVGGMTTFAGATIVLVGFLVRRKVSPISSERGNDEAVPRRGIPTS